MKFISDLDHNFLAAMFEGRSVELINLNLFITSLGGATFILVAGILLGIYLLYRREKRDLVTLIITILGTLGTVYIMKLGFGRERPMGDVAYYLENSLSFPSAHAAAAVAFYGYFTRLVYQKTENRYYEITTFVFGVMLILLISFSRMYLGVHYLSDVVGGILVGSAWLYYGPVAAKYFRK